MHLGARRDWSIYIKRSKTEIEIVVWSSYRDITRKRATLGERRLIMLMHNFSYLTLK